MSLLNEQIDVRSTIGGTPAQFIWRGHTFRVRRVIGDWPVHAGAQGQEPTTDHLLRVSAESEAGEASIVDIAKDTGTDRWTVRRQWN